MKNKLLLEALRSGTIASLAMMPFGFLFKWLGLRVGHYGPKLGELLFGLQPEPWMKVLLLAQHFVIGWLSAVPLLLYWLARAPRPVRWVDGLVYGLVYYVAVNALALPWWFGDAFPWQLGWAFVYPSLVVHLVFGLCIAATARVFGFGVLLRAPDAAMDQLAQLAGPQHGAAHGGADRPLGGR